MRPKTKETWWKKLGLILLNLVFPFGTLLEAGKIYWGNRGRFAKEAALIPAWSGAASSIGLILFGSLMVLGSLSLLGPLAPLMSLSLPVLALCGYACMYAAKFIGTLVGHLHLCHSYPEAKKIITPGKMFTNSLAYALLGSSFKYVRELFSSLKNQSSEIPETPDEEKPTLPKANRNKNPLVAWSEKNDNTIRLDSHQTNATEPVGRIQPRSTWRPVMLPGSPIHQKPPSPESSKATLPPSEETSLSIT